MITLNWRPRYVEKLSLCSLLLLLLACNKKDIVGPAGPAGSQGPAGTDSVLKGNMQGKIAMYDTSGNPLDAGGGATVSLENTSPLIQASTSADGSFTLQSARAGYYTVSVQKPGFGTMRFLNQIVTGTATASQTGILIMGQQMSSDNDIKLLKIDSGVETYGTHQPYLIFTLTLAHPHMLHSPQGLIYYNDVTGVGNNNNKAVLWAAFNQPNDSTLTIPEWNYPTSLISDQLAKSNSLYFTIALDNPKHISYKDENGNTVYPDAAKPAPEVYINNSLHKF